MSITLCSWVYNLKHDMFDKSHGLTHWRVNISKIRAKDIN
jgi:hypothetical protein